MKNFLKYLGLIFIIIGVAVLAIPQFMEQTTNLTLGIGILTMVIGLLLHIFINKRIID